ncbi:MAG: AAA family ATPase [Pyrodictiaceae archaeon]
MSSKCMPIKAMQEARISEAAENLGEELRHRLLSRVGLLGGQEEAVKRIKAFIGEAEAASRIGESLVMVIIGEWGLGKTFLYEVLRREALERGMEAIYIQAGRLVDEASRLASSRGLGAGEAIGLALLGSREPRRPVVVFLDELEWLIGRRAELVAGRGVVEAFIDFIKSLRSNVSGLGLQGKLHLVIASTPTAFQMLLSLLRDYGYHGWLVRREHIVRLYPSSKIDSFRLLEAVVEEATGLQLQQLLEDPRLVEILYMLSLGNPGLLVSLANQLISFLSAVCGERGCLCRASPALVLEALYTLKTGSAHGPTTLVSHEPLRRLLQAPNKALVAALAGLVYEDEEGLEDALEYFGDSLVPGNAYILGGLDEAEKFLGEALEKLSLKVGDEDYLVRLVLGFFIHLAPDGRLVFFIPHDRDEAARRLLLSGAAPISPSDIEKLEELARRYSGPLRAYSLPLSVLMEYYPAIKPRTSIDFLPRPEEAAEALREAQRLAYHDPGAFEEYARSFLVEMLEELGLVYRDKLSSTTYLVYQEGELEARVRARIGVLLDPSRIEDAIGDCGDEEVCIVLYSELGPGRPRISRWNVFAVAAKPLDLQAMTALSIARRRGYFIDKEALRSFREKLAQSYRLLGIGREWARRALEKGVLVPHRLLGLERVARQSRMRELEFFKNGYYALLVGGAEFSIQQLAEKLVALYRARPYHRGSSWCEIPVPAFLSLDMEPEDAQGVLDPEKTRQRILEKLYTIIDIAVENRMAARENRMVRLRLHPVEERILGLLRENGGAMPLRELRRRFVFFHRAGGGPEAYSDQVFRALLEILERRGLVRIESRRTRRLDDQVVLMSAEQASRIISEAIREYESFLEEARRLLSMVEHRAPRLLLHIAIAKAKGWKLITIQDLYEAVEAARRGVEAGAQQALILLELARYARRVLEGFMARGAMAVLGILEEAEKHIASIRSLAALVDDRAGLLDELSSLQLLASDVVEEAESIQRKLSMAVRGLETLEDLQLLGSSLLGSQAQRRSLSQVFWYDKGCSHRAGFNLVAYTLMSLVEEKRLMARLMQLRGELEKLVERLDRLGSILSRARSLEGYEDIVRALRSRLRALGATSSIDQALRVLDEAISRAESELEEAARRLEEKEKARELLEEATRLIKDLEERIARVMEVLPESSLLPAGLGKRLERLREGFSEARARLSKLSSWANASPEELLEEARRMEDLVRKLEGEAKRLASEASKSIRSEALELQNRLRIACSLAGEECLLEAKRVDQLLARLKEATRYLDAGGWEGLREYWEARKSLIEILSRLESIALKASGGIALELYAILSSRTNRGWRLHELVEEASKKLGVGEEEVLKTLLVLDKKGLVKISLGLPGREG